MALKILLAEDNPDIQSLVRHCLEGDGYEVCVAGDGKEALDLFREFEPDLMILDVMMPRVTGFEVLRLLRDRHELRRQTPVLILSARTAEQDVLTGFDLGVDDYLAKPFAIGELRARVRTLLSRRPGA